MKYAAVSRSNRYYELLNESGSVLGDLHYTNPFLLINAEIKLIDGESYSLASANIWQTKIKIEQGGKFVGLIEFTLPGNILIRLESGQCYLYKKEGFFKIRYYLSGKHYPRMITVNQQFNGVTFCHDYYLDANDDHRESRNALLLVLLIYSTKFMRIRKEAQ